MIETKVRWSGGMKFTGATDSKHLVIMDTSPKFGGKGEGPTPMQLVLIALGGCTGMDVVSILKKMGVGIDGLEIELRGEREENHPRVYRWIEIKYALEGRNLVEEKVKKAIDLSQSKYCSIVAMLEKECEIRYTYEII
jgi:putative redox protein